MTTMYKTAFALLYPAALVCVAIATAACPWKMLPLMRRRYAEKANA